MGGVFAGGFEGVELGAEVVQFGAEVAYPFEGLFLFRGVEFLLGELVVLVYCAGEGCEGGREGAQRGGC